MSENEPEIHFAYTVLQSCFLSTHAGATLVLVGGIIGELLGALLIAAFIIASGCAIGRKLRRRGMTDPVV